MAYDSGSDRVILFGGLSGSSDRAESWPSGAWAYDFNSNAWARLAAPVEPATRFGHAVAYDTQAERVILFGGNTGGSTTSHTWAYDFRVNRWADLSSMGSPLERAGHALVYDTESHRIVLFGGSPSPAEGLLSDTWSYDSGTNSWAHVTTTAAPSSRERHAMVYDSESDRTILFGGSSAGR